MNNEEQEYLCWVRLARTKNIGAITFWRIINYYGNSTKAVDQFADIQSRTRRKIELASLKSVEAELQRHQQIGAKLLCSYQSEYPELLKQVDNPPPLLSVRGNIEVLQRKCVGIVGSRNCSIHGRSLAKKIATDLGQSGWGIASGLARGIDGAAHQGAVNSGTIAVVAGGVDIIYPSEHTSLYHDLQQHGAVVSEMPLGMHPGATHFPRRNRIISGLCHGVVVIEAARRSGSLITARYAIEQNREVFAVPGSPSDPRCQGANDLLKQGATLVVSAEDIIDAISSNVATQLNSQAKESSSSYLHGMFDESELQFEDSQMIEEMQDNRSIKLRILDLLSTIPLPTDELIRELNLPTHLIMQTLSELEINEQIIRHPNSTVTIGLESRENR